MEQKSQIAETEQKVLSCLLSHGRLARPLADNLTAEDFTLGEHKALFTLLAGWDSSATDMSFLDHLRSQELWSDLGEEEGLEFITRHHLPLETAKKLVKEMTSHRSLLAKVIRKKREKDVVSPYAPFAKRKKAALWVSLRKAAYLEIRTLEFLISLDINNPTSTPPELSRLAKLHELASEEGSFAYAVEGESDVQQQFRWELVKQETLCLEYVTQTWRALSPEEQVKKLVLASVLAPLEIRGQVKRLMPIKLEAALSPLSPIRQSKLLDELVTLLGPTHPTAEHTELIEKKLAALGDRRVLQDRYLRAIKEYWTRDIAEAPDGHIWAVINDLAKHLHISRDDAAAMACVPDTKRLAWLRFWRDRELVRASKITATEGYNYHPSETDPHGVSDLFWMGILKNDELTLEERHVIMLSAASTSRSLMALSGETLQALEDKAAREAI